MGALLGIGALVVCLVVGAILLGLGHLVIGIVVLLAAVPAAIVTWMKWSDRKYGG
jgi:predicted permease